MNCSSHFCFFTQWNTTTGYALRSSISHMNLTNRSPFRSEIISKNDTIHPALFTFTLCGFSHFDFTTALYFPTPWIHSNENLTKTLREPVEHRGWIHRHSMRRHLFFLYSSGSRRGKGKSRWQLKVSGQMRVGDQESHMNSLTHRLMCLNHNIFLLNC